MCGTAGGGVEALLDVDVGLPSCLSKNPSSASTTKSAVKWKLRKILNKNKL